MTGLLNRVMHERADQLPTPQLDLDQILRDGRRRLRRNRLATAAASVAAVAAVATAVPLATGHWDTSGEQIAPATPPPFEQPQITYAVGSTIHYGERTIDVGGGLKVASLVPTDHGFVFATGDGRVYFTDGDGAEPVGHTSRDGLYLKADGPLAAWVEFPRGQAPVFVVYDTSTGQRVLETSEGNRPGMKAFRDTDAAYIYGIDGNQVYWRSGLGAVRHDLGTGQSTVLAADANPFDISDIENGRIAHTTREPEGEDTKIRVSTDLTRPGDPMPSGWRGVLSPAAGYVAVDEADEMAVYDVATHADVSPSTTGYAFVTAYEWLDEHTVVMIGLERLDDTEPFDILTCTVPSGACKVAVDDAATFPGFTLPVGERID